MRKGLLFLALFACTWISAQRPAGDAYEKYWIFFKDKGSRSWQPEEVLSPRALARRTQQGIPVTSADWPVSADYLALVKAHGAELRQNSRWFNAASARMASNTAAEIAALPFVESVQPIRRYIRDLDAPTQAASKLGYEQGLTRYQLEMIGLDQLHQNGYNGRGVLVAVMDNGFIGANENPHLAHLFQDNRILATRDFVNGEEDVFDQGTHGQWVLSILAGWYEDSDPAFNHYGSAHGATYILCHTEADGSETTQEEDNWVAAMEWADSLGADLFTTSLGYRDFDGGFDYGYAGMDGNTTIITRGADMAAARGIVVVNSAGNAGNNKISAPADGDSVIAVGAVDSLRVIAGFSSRGPSYDGRIKPDVCAMGVATAFIQPNGSFSRGNGTSFSCPVLSGMLACLLQAKPGTPNMDLYRILIQSADRHDNPDSLYGYGIPDANAAFEALTGISLSNSPSPSDWAESDGMIIYPNPASKVFHIAIDNETVAYPARIEWIDARGAIVWSKEVDIAPFYNVFRFDRDADGVRLASGSYTVRVLNTAMKTVVATEKILFAQER